MAEFITQHDLSVSFYNEFGDLCIYAKQYDTQRDWLFEFSEEVIPEERSNFFATIRGQFSDGSLVPFLQADASDITDETILFHIPSANLAVPGRAKCDLVLSVAKEGIQRYPSMINTILNYSSADGAYKESKTKDATGDKNGYTDLFESDYIIYDNTQPVTMSLVDWNAKITWSDGTVTTESGTSTTIKVDPVNYDTTFNPDGTPSDPDAFQILTTHTFYLHIEPVATEGATVTEHDYDMMSNFIQTLISIQSQEAQRQANETQRIQNEIKREDKEIGYIKQAHDWAVGPQDTTAKATSTFNSKYFSELAQQTVDNHEYVHLQIENDGHLYMYKAGSANTVNFTIENNKDLYAIFNT